MAEENPPANPAADEEEEEEGEGGVVEEGEGEEEEGGQTPRTPGGASTGGAETPGEGEEDGEGAGAGAGAETPGEDALTPGAQSPARGETPGEDGDGRGGSAGKKKRGEEYEGEGEGEDEAQKLDETTEEIVKGIMDKLVVRATDPMARRLSQLSSEPTTDDMILEELLHSSNMAYERAANIEELKAAIKDWERNKTKDDERPPADIQKKREDLLTQLREFDAIARRIDRLCALTDKYSSEDFLPRLKRDSIADAVGKRLSELCDMMEKELQSCPEYSCCAYCAQEAQLPKLVVCGPRDHVPMIVFCDPGGKKIGKPPDCEPGMCARSGSNKIEVPKGPQYATKKECMRFHGPEDLAGMGGANALIDQVNFMGDELKKLRLENMRLAHQVQSLNMYKDVQDCLARAAVAELTRGGGGSCPRPPYGGGGAGGLGGGGFGGGARAVPCSAATAGGGGFGGGAGGMGGGGGMGCGGGGGMGAGQPPACQRGGGGGMGAGMGAGVACPPSAFPRQLFAGRTMNPCTPLPPAGVDKKTGYYGGPACGINTDYGMR